MTSIINKLLGKDHDNEHAHKTETKCESGSCSTTVAAAHKQGAVKTSECDSASCSRNTGKESETHAVQRDGVNIKSTISTEGNSTVSLANQQKLVDLVSKLGSTYSQIDDYAKNQTEKINEEIQREIDEVVGRTRREQEELLRKAQAHTDDIDKEYRARLQLMVEEVDAAKAKRISEIEVELNNQQTGILQAARNEIDALNKKAARLKIGVLEAAEAKVAADARNISAQPLDKASTVHVATGTTTIKTEVVAAANTTVAGSGSSSSAAAGEVHVATGGAKHVSETKTVETKHQSHETKK